MKQILAILLIAVHLVNSGGYRMLFDHFEQQAGQKMVSWIDTKGYDEQDLVEIRVPVNLPYQTNWTDFERYDGEVVMNGVHYNYVKRKLHNDTLILMCLPNAEKTQLFNARETFFSLVNDLQQESPDNQGSSPHKSVKFSQTECIVQELSPYTQIPAMKISSSIVDPSSSLTSCFIRTNGQPPEGPAIS